MKKNILGLSLLLLCACQSDENGGSGANTRTDIKLTASEQTIVDAGTTFAFGFMQAIEQAEGEKESYFVSPLSASLALSMVTNGANGNTLSEMKRALGFGTYTIDELNDFYAKLVAGLMKVDKTTELAIANSIWVNKDFPVKDAFMKVNREKYDAEVRVIDFFTPQAVPTINQWCSDQTKGRIDEIVKTINPLTRMILLNALYFKGTWVYQFDKKFTMKTSFTNHDHSTTSVDMMMQTEKLPYLEEANLKIAELPYGNEAYSMVVLLPQNDQTPEQVIAALTPEMWNGWMERLPANKTTIDVAFPKFTRKFERSLVDDLKQMGMLLAFDGRNADFSKISDAFLYISDVRQNTFVEVNEEGTEAAAVTVVTMDTNAFPSNPAFRVDRPFVYFIKEKSTGAILFAGKMLSME